MAVYFVCGMSCLSYLSIFIITIVLHVPSGGRKKSPRTCNRYCYYSACRTRKWRTLRSSHPFSIDRILHHVVGFVFTDIWVDDFVFPYKFLWTRVSMNTKWCPSITPIPMNQLKKPILKLTALNMHSVSSVQIPQNVTNFSLLQPSVRLKPLNLHSASSFHVPSISINKCFTTNLK